MALDPYCKMSALMYSRFVADPEIDRALSKPIKARQGWMDALRGAAILLIMSLHASVIITMFGREPWAPTVQFNDLFAPYRMPLLMLLSGLLVEPSLKKGPLLYFEGKLRNIVYPYILWSAFYGFTISTDFVWYDYKSWIGRSYLWFLLFLMVFYCAAFLLQWFNGLVIAVVCLTLSLLMPDETKYQERLFYLMGTFFLGVFIGGNKILIDRMIKPKLIFVAMPIVIAFSIWSLLSGGIRFKTEWIVPTLLGIVVLIYLAKLLGSTPVLAPVGFIGRKSIIFYILHYPLMYFLTLLCLENGITSSMAISILAFTVSIPVCWFFANLHERSGMVTSLFTMPRPAVFSKITNSRSAGG
jgi:uncharacterized membrane protein YcfT